MNGLSQSPPPSYYRLQNFDLLRLFKKCMTSHYCEFGGRARRAEFWGFYFFSSTAYNILQGIGFYFVLPFMIYAIAMGGSDAVGPEAPFGMVNIAQLIFQFVLPVLLGLAFFLPLLGVTVRRLHDVGYSGWWLLLLLVPLFQFIFAIILFALLLTRGTVDPNRYGDDPAVPDPIPEGVDPALVQPPVPYDLWASFKKCITSHFWRWGGRARRAEYAGFMIFGMLFGFAFGCAAMILSFIMMIIAFVSMGGKPSHVEGVMTFMLCLTPVFVVMGAFMIAQLNATIRRFHDFDYSGWWIFAMLVPGLNAVLMAFLYTKPGTVGANRFGPDPLIPELVFETPVVIEDAILASEPEPEAFDPKDPNF